MSKFVDGIEFVTEQCCTCGMAFAITRDFERRRSNDHKLFYCPSGHRQYYAGKTEAQKLKDQLDQLKRERDYQGREINNLTSEVEHQRRKAAASKGHVTRLKNRAANGVCPCCQRHFKDLHRHMQSQHPNFLDGDDLRSAMKTIRERESLSQAEVGKQAGLKSSAYVSMFERNKPLPAEAKQALIKWINDKQTA